jgi:phage baseplate assembly protein W
MVQNVTRITDWKDLDLNFGRHPVTGDVSKLKGVEAIKRSIRNCVLYHFYEKPFNPSFGSNATKLLFENINPMTATFLENAIRETIRNFEPRGEVLGVKVIQKPDENGYEAGIAFKPVNLPEPLLVTIFLERIR